MVKSSSSDTLDENGKNEINTRPHILLVQDDGLRILANSLSPTVAYFGQNETEAVLQTTHFRLSYLLK